MKPINGTLLALLVWLGGVTPAAADELKQAVAIPDFFISGDSDGFQAIKAGGSYLPRYEHGDSYIGAGYQFNHYLQNGWSASGNQVGLIAKNINPHNGLGYSASLYVNQMAGGDLLTTDSTYGFKLGGHTQAEIMLNRDRVETENGLNHGTFYTMPGVSLEQQLVERFSVIATAGDMIFSDGNNRPIFRVRAIYDLWPDYGLTAQIRYRQFHDTNTSVANNYFNPDRYNETMVAMGMRQRINGWMLAGTAGIGRQTVNSDPSTTTELLEANAASPFVGGVFFRVKLGYSKSATFQGPDYSYRYFMNELIFSF